MMKHIHTIVLLLMMLLPLGSMAQSLEIVEEFKENKMSTVLTTYKNEFGHREKQHVLDNKFPFAVLEVYLEGDEQAVKAAKSKISLDLGSHFTVEGVCKTYTNRIVFLISSSVHNVYMTCGDGCKEQVIFSGQTLEQNRIYYGRVKYTPAKVATISGSPEPTKRQYFTFQVTPANATVQVLEDGQWELWEKEDGVFSKSLYYGTYSYKVYADRFQTEEGTIELNDTCKEKVVKLLPDYGWLTIESSTVSKGASVFITSKQMSEPKFIGTIPFKNKELDKGEYVLQVQQNKYKNYLQNITIHPNKTTTLAPELSPNFVSLTLSTDSESEIYVDGKRYAKGSWTGTLELGEYSIEARKQYHRSVVKIVHITDNHANQTIEIDSPQPIYGSLHVKGTPSKASVYVDGEMVGTSPLIVNDLLIGEHEVKVEKDGCAVWKKTVTVADNEECIAQYELEKGVSLERVVLKGMNATNLSVKRAGDETLLFTYDLPKKGPVRLKMSTDGYTYVDQKNVKGAVGKEIDKGEGYQIAWTIPKDLGRTMQDSLYFQIVALPELPKEKIKIGSLYYTATDNGTSVAVVRPPYKKGTYEHLEYTFKKIAIPAEINYKGYKYSVTSIGHGAFYYCRNLTSITIPNSVTSIGKEAFYSCDNLNSITIPNSVTSIESSAFEDCDKLTSITIPNSVTSIGKEAFERCDNLTSITIPNTVTSIGDDAFYATPWYKNYAKGKDVVYIGKVLYAHNNANLTGVFVKEGTISITRYAFRGCKSLQSISIPNSVRYIDYTALNYCSSLAKITIDDGNPWLDSRDNCNAIIETKTSKLLIGCKNTVIPNSVTSIGSSAFEDCSNLSSITIPNSVTSIESHAFYGCKNLTSITIPSSVTSIGTSAFSGCDNLTSITIPNSVTSIGSSAFYSCDNLSEIHLPTGMEDKFNKMEGIKDFYKQREKKNTDGYNYYYGRNGVKQDYTKAVSYFRIAATQGHSSAQYYLGWCYHHNQGVTKDLTEAKKWYQKAADQGHEDAKKQLANIQKEETEKAYTDGWNYYYGKNGVKQDYTKAVSYFRIAATQGHADAQNYLGICYDNGLGVNEDDVEAVKWYRKAAEQGNKYGQDNLGFCYYYGEGVDKNYVEAVKWFRKAAEQGHGNAQNNLGHLYEHGEGVDKNYVEAVKWYRKAAEQGHSSAQTNLGDQYYKGEGVEQNYAEAVKWFRKAAEQGEKYAQYNLGVCYQYGNGVTKNLTEAKKWYQKAADQGHENAKKKLKELQ